MAAFAASKPGRIASPQEAEIEALRVDNARWSEALKELAGRVDAVAGKSTLGLAAGPVPARVDGDVKEGLLTLVDDAVASGWAHTRACQLLGVADVRTVGAVGCATTAP